METVTFNAKQVADEARRLSCWIYDTVRNVWFSPDDFAREFKGINAAAPFTFELRDPRAKLAELSETARFILREWLHVSGLIEKSGIPPLFEGFLHAGALAFPLSVSGVTNDKPMEPAEVEHYGAPFFVAETMAPDLANLIGALYNVKIVVK